MSTPASEVTSGRRKKDENATNPAGFLASASGEAHQFGPFVLAAGEGRLLKGGHPLPIAPKPYETLLYLVRHPHRVISKQELLDAVWPDTHVTDDVLVQCVVEIRRVLGDHAREPSYVETIPRRGYSFIASVQRVDFHANHPRDASPTPPTQTPAVTPPQPEEQAPTAAGDDAGAPPGDRLAPADRLTPFPAQVGAGPAPAIGTRRHAWSLLAAVAALALSAVAALWWTGLLSRSQVAEAGTYRPESGTVAVLPVQMVDSADEARWLRTGFGELVSGELASRQALRVVPRRQLVTALEAAGFSEGAFVPGEAALRVGRAVLAERVIISSYQRVGEQFTMNARLVDVATGRLERQFATSGDRRSDLLESLGRLCRQIGDTLAPVAGGAGETASRAVAAPTSSMEALRAYSQALDAEARGGRDGLAQAQRLLEEATRLDADFARAYLRMAVVEEARQRWGYGATDPRSTVRRARELRNRLPERERLQVDAMSALLLDNEPGRAIELWNSLLTLYPAYAQDAGVPRLVTDTLMTQGRWADLILAGAPYLESTALPRDDRAMLNGLLAYAYRRRGEFQQALTCATRALDLWPAREGPAVLRVRTLLGRILVDAGRKQSALDVFRQVAVTPGADVVNVTDAAWGLYMAGDGSGAAAVVAKALAIDPNYGNAYHLRGWLALARGEHDAAARDLALAFEKTPIGFGSPEQGFVSGDVAALYFAGVARDKAGDRRAALALWRKVDAHCRDALRPGSTSRGHPVVRWQAEQLIAMTAAQLGEAVRDPGPLAGDEIVSLVQEARLLALEGRLERAVASLRKAIALGAGDIQHIKDDPTFERLHALPEFQALLAPFNGT